MIRERSRLHQRIGVVREAGDVLEGEAGGPLVRAGGEKRRDLKQLAVPAAARGRRRHAQIVQDGADLPLISL